MDSEDDDAGRGYLLPSGCVDLIDALRLRAGGPGVPKEAKSPERDKEVLEGGMDEAFAKQLTAGLPEQDPAGPFSETTVQRLAEALGVKTYRLLHELTGLGIAAGLSTILTPEVVRFLTAKYGKEGRSE